MKHPIVLTVAGQPHIVSEDELVFARVVYDSYVEQMV